MESWYVKGRIAELLAQSCRILGKLELTSGAAGHVSFRLEGETMLIKGKGREEVALRQTAPRDILEADFSAETVEGPEGLRPPSESFIHTAIYEAHPDARSVIHCHAKVPALMALCNLELLPMGGVRPGMSLAVNGVPTYPRSHLIASAERGRDLVMAMGESPVVILRGHGVAVYGSSIEDATVRTLALNELATINYEARLLGVPGTVLSEDIAERRPQGMGRRGSEGGPSKIVSSWRYYCDLIGEQSLI